MQTAEHIRLKGSTHKRGPYMEAKLYGRVVEAIVKCIAASRTKIITNDDLTKAIAVNPPVRMQTSDLTWIILQVKNDLLYRKLLMNSFEDFTQRIQFTPEGEKFFELGL
jgi:hypothetical protein